MSRSKAPRPSPPRSLVLTPHQLAAIVRHAETSYPEEACGLIVGRRLARGMLEADRIVESANLAIGDARHRFEVDPALRLRLERELRDSGEAVIGHYHSHPDHPAEPSARDLEAGHEPELAWLIVSVERGKARACGAYRLEREARRSTALALRLAEDAAQKPAPRRAAARKAR